MKNRLMQYFGVSMLAVLIFFIFTDVVISPYFKIPIVDQEKPDVIYVTGYDQYLTETLPKKLLIDDPEVIDSILTDVKYTWVTNLKSLPVREP